MAILPYRNADDLPEEYRALLARGTNGQRTVMHSLEGGKAYLAFGHWIRFKSRLDPRLREMIILQVSYLRKNEYELSHHIKIARDFGVVDSDFRAIVEATAGRPTTLAPSEAVALRAAREIVQDRQTSAATNADILAHFTPELFVELVLIAGFYTFVDLFLASMRVDVEDAYRPYLAAMPFAEP